MSPLHAKVRWMRGVIVVGYSLYLLVAPRPDHPSFRDLPGLRPESDTPPYIMLLRLAG